MGIVSASAERDRRSLLDGARVRVPCSYPTVSAICWQTYRSWLENSPTTPRFANQVWSSSACAGNGAPLSKLREFATKDREASCANASRLRS